MKKQYFSVILSALLIILCGMNVQGQIAKSFSLQEAINYALENNYNIRSSKLDLLIQHKKVKEYIATGYPQIASNVKYNYYLDIPTQLIPGEIFGQPGTLIPVQFGTKNNASVDVSWNQLMFNGSFFVGLEANKKLKELSERTVKKSEIDVKESVAKAYYLVLVSEENKKIIDSTLNSLRKILSDTKEYYKNGFVENTDVDQFELLVSNLETTKKTIDIKTELAYKLLKLQMGYPFEDNITLTENLETLFAGALNVPTTGYDYKQSIDYNLLETQRKLAFINLKYEKSKYLPALNGFFTYSESGMGDKVTDLSGNMYATSMIGVTLSIPIFNSGMKMYRVQQAKYSFDKSKLILDQVKESLLIQEESARTDYQIAALTYENKKKSLNIAKSIYYKTSVKYSEGISSSLDLSQSYNQYLSTQTDYINSIMQLLNSKQLLEKIYTKTN